MTLLQKIATPALLGALLFTQCKKNEGPSVQTPLRIQYKDSLAGTWTWHHWTTGWSGSTSYANFVGDTALPVTILSDSMIRFLGADLLYSNLYYHGHFKRNYLTSPVDTSHQLYYLDTLFQWEHGERSLTLYLSSDSVRFMEYGGGLGGGASESYYTILRH